jgi:hypothetical protein
LRRGGENIARNAKQRAPNQQPAKGPFSGHYSILILKPSPWHVAGNLVVRYFEIILLSTQVPTVAYCFHAKAIKQLRPPRRHKSGRLPDGASLDWHRRSGATSAQSVEIRHIPRHVRYGPQGG